MCIRDRGCKFDSTSFPCVGYSDPTLKQSSLDGYNTVYWLKQIAHRIGIVNNNIGPSPTCTFDSTYFPYTDPTCTSYTQWSLDGYNTVYWLKQIAYNIKGGSSGNAWLLTGNTGTTSGNFIGTTDRNPLFFETNGTPAMNIDLSQNLNSVAATWSLNQDGSTSLGNGGFTTDVNGNITCLLYTSRCV